MSEGDLRPGDVPGNWGVVASDAGDEEEEEHVVHEGIRTGDSALVGVFGIVGSMACFAFGVI